MSHKYTLQPTRADHPIKQRLEYTTIRQSINALEEVGLEALAKIEALLHPLPPDPVPPAPGTPIEMLPLLQDTEDQGQQGSCFAFGGTHAQNLCEGIQGKAQSPVTYSPACLSWNTRALMGTTDQDSGGNLGDAIQSQEQTGTCLSSLMPYNQDVFNVPPDAAAVADEANHKAKFKAYPLDISKWENITTALADGCPVYFGFFVWQGFEDGAKSDGTVPPPDGTNLGGHANLLFFTSTAPAGTAGDQNSWGKTWGLNGRCWFPSSAIGTLMEAYALVPLDA